MVYLFKFKTSCFIVSVTDIILLDTVSGHGSGGWCGLVLERLQLHVVHQDQCTHVRPLELHVSSTSIMSMPYGFSSSTKVK